MQFGVHGWASGVGHRRSSEHSVQIPTLGLALLKNPQRRALAADVRLPGAQCSNRAPRPCRPTNRSRCVRDPVPESNRSASGSGASSSHTGRGMPSPAAIGHSCRRPPEWPREVQFMDAPPGRFGPMFRDGRHPVHRLLAQTRAQALHQLRRAVSRPTPVPAPRANPAKASSEPAESGCREPEINSMSAHRRRQFEPRQFLAQHIRQAAPFAGDARQSHIHAGCGTRAVPQLQPQCLHAGLALAQEPRTARDQRLERLFQISDGLDLRLEIAAHPKTFARHECPARRGLPRQRNVEILHRGRTQAARQTGARQAQQFTQPRHTHGAQGLQPFRSSQAVQAMGNSAMSSGQRPQDLRCALQTPARASHSAARVEGAVALQACSSSSRQQASMAACKVRERAE